MRLSAALTLAALFASGPESALAAPLAPPATSRPLFTLEAARQIVTDSSPAISPDGRSVVYVRTHSDYKTDKRPSELVLIDLASGLARTLTHDRDGVASPAWAPGGDRLAFLASPAAGKPPQLYVMPMNGGDALRVTDANNGVSAFAWRPDGAAFAFVAEDEAPNEKDLEKHLDAFAVGDESYLDRAAPQPSHVWTVAADGSGAKQITTGPASFAAGAISVLKWSPDGKTLLYSRQPDALFAHFTKTQVIARNVTSGAETVVAGLPVVTFADYSRDGGRIVYFAPRHGSLYLQNDAYVIDAKSGARLADTLKIDRNAHWAGFLPDGSLLYGAPDGVRNALWALAPSGAARRLDLGDVDFGDDATLANDGTLAFVGLTATQPPEIYVLPPGSSSPRRVSADNQFALTYKLGAPARIDWTTGDGMPACGVLTYPPNYEPGKTYPLVLVIHGGPVSSSTQNFNVLDQVLAAHGFLVFNPNYRGSDDEGDAYLKAIVGHPTSGPGNDNLAGLAAVEKLGIVDTSRIGVSGWSGGGLQTSWLIGHAHVWKAAMTGAGVDDWFEQAVLADINEEFADVFMGTTPWTPSGRALFDSESPIAYANQISTPTLILSDTRDQRVPVSQSYALYHALEERGVPVKFVAFPRAGHFPSDPVGLESVYRTWSEWFATELK